MSLSESVDDVMAHERLYDANVNSRIEDSEDAALEPARELLDRIERRDLYVAIHTVDVAKIAVASEMVLVAFGSSFLQSRSHGPH